MKKLFVFALILLVPVAFAFDLTIPEATLKVPIGKTTEVNITLHSPIKDQFILSVSDSKSWLTVVTSQPMLSPNETKQISLLMNPLADTQSGTYRIRIYAESINTSFVKWADMYVQVAREEGAYIQEVLIGGDLEPLGSLTTETKIRNYGMNTIQFAVLNQRIYSSKGLVYESNDTIDKISSDSYATVQKKFSLGEQATGGNYHVDATLVYKDKVIANLTQEFNVKEKAILEKSSGEFSLMFGWGMNVYVRNRGNIPVTYTLNERVSPFDGVFLSGAEPTSRGEIYSWELQSIMPGETRTVTYRVDYTGLFVTSTAILILGWFFFYKMRTLRVRKYIIQKKFIEEGEEFTVGIDLKNASGKKLDKIVIRDFIPPVFEIKDTEGMKPTKKRSESGTELTWELKDIANREERVLSYKIIPLFGIYGRIRLPRSIIKYTAGSREKGTVSEFADIGIDTVEKPGVLGDVFNKKNNEKSYR